MERDSERQERGGPGSRRHRSGGHGRGAPRTHTRARTPAHTRSLHTATHAPRLRRADSLQQSRVTTAQEGAGARRRLARTEGRGRVIGFLGPLIANPLPPSRAWRAALGITRAPFSVRDPKGTPATVTSAPSQP